MPKYLNIADAPLRESAPNGMLGVDENGRIIRSSSRLSAEELQKINDATEAKDAIEATIQTVSDSINQITQIRDNINETSSELISSLGNLQSQVDSHANNISTLLNQADEIVEETNIARQEIQETRDEFFSYGWVPSGAGIMIPEGTNIPEGWYVDSVTNIGQFEYSIIIKGTMPTLIEMIGGRAEPQNARVGENITLIEGSYQNARRITSVLVQNSLDKTSEIVDGIWSPSEGGQYTYTVTVLGAAGQQYVTSVSGEITIPVTVDWETGYYNILSPSYAGNSLAVTSVTTSGTNPITLQVTSTGNEVTISDEGSIVFNNGKFLSASNTSPPSNINKIIVAGKFKIDAYGSGLGHLFTPTPSGAQLGLYNNNGIAQARYFDTATRTVPLGAIPYGEEFVAGLMIDKENSVLYAYGPSKEIITINLSTDVRIDYSTVRFGQYIIGEANQISLFIGTSDKEIEYEFSDVIENLTNTLISVPPIEENINFDIIMGRGQSLELGANAGALFAPNGSRWREVFSNTENAYMLQGLVREDGVNIVNVTNPLLKGYDHITHAVGITPMVVQTSIPGGAVRAGGLLREGISSATLYQFHDAGGQSIQNLDDDPETGTIGIVAPYQNSEWWLANAKEVMDANGITGSVSRIFINQGEADVSRERGWWLENANNTVNQWIEQIQRILGQEEEPRIFIDQTGGYMFNSHVNLHQCKLDQIDLIKQRNGVLTGPMYPFKIDNSDGRGVHKTFEDYVKIYEIGVWSVVETEAGRNWNLLPISANRSGNTITIHMSTRNDETLTVNPGMYSLYGGDPENLGLEVVGGGTITSSTVSGNNIIIEVSGEVTSIRYAMQRTSTDYRTLVDDNNHGYCAHRGIIKTTLTKTIEWGGQQFILERWVPSFEVEVE